MKKELYPGIAFSPQTTLAENIGAADTIIKVSDVSAFPEAPNLATIGIDVDGETILYTAKTENALSDCQRGIEGAAKAWRAGEIIGRNFTAKDHNDLIENLVELETAADAAAEGVGAIQAAKGAADGFASLQEDGTVTRAQRAITDDADRGTKFFLGVEAGKLYIMEAD